MTNKSKTTLTLILIFISFNVLSHGHHTHEPEEILKVYEQIHKDLNHSRNRFAAGDSAISFKDASGRIIKVHEETMTSIIRSSLLINRDIILGHCAHDDHCDPHKLAKQIDSRMKRWTKKSLDFIKHNAHEIKEIFTDTLYDAVTGVRRYGVLYATLLVTGEVIEHGILHNIGVMIPLCKVVQAGTVKLLSGAKHISLTLTGKLPTNDSLRERVRLLAKNFQYKREYQKHLNYYFAYADNPNIDKLNWWEKFKKTVLFKSDFKESTKRNFYLNDISENPELLIKKIDPEVNPSKYQARFEVQRRIESFNFLIQTNEVYLKGMYEEGHISRKEYITSKWRLGAIGNEVDKFHVYTLALNEGPKSVFYQRQVKDTSRLLIKTLEEFTKAPYDESFKIHLKSLKGKMQVFHRNNCELPFVYNVL